MDRNPCRALAALLLAAAVAMAGPAAAQQDHMMESGDYVVHFNALPSDRLTPEVARAARVTRSPNRALLTIAVQRRGSDGAPLPVTASIEAAATNLAGQWRQVPMRQVRDGEAIYYLGEHGISHLETMNYVLEVRPEGAVAPIAVRFQQQFFTR